MVELLFAEGMLRLLVATETVAMGLNLPARTVLFASPTKWDGQRHRLLLPTEYTQMSGRAGRRGRDAQGHAVLLVSHWVAAAEAEELLSRRFGALRSGFALRHSSLLKLVRAEGASASTVLSRTLRAWQARAAARGRRADAPGDGQAGVTTGNVRWWRCPATRRVSPSCSRIPPGRGQSHKYSAWHCMCSWRETLPSG